MIYLVLFSLFGSLLLVECQSPTNPDFSCYITISDGLEYCYYYPSIGYQCDYGYNNQDPSHRNLTECSYYGLCYIPVSGGDEVCYYTAPYGYDCYFQNDPNVTIWMKNCDDLKANAAPEITFTISNPQVSEDVELPFPYIIIADADADDGIRENNGYLDVTLTVKNGIVTLYNITQYTATEVKWPFGGYNDSIASGSLVRFQARQRESITSLRTILSPLMKSLVIKSDPNFNTESTGKMIEIKVKVNDMGNTGGTEEIAEKTITIKVNAVNDPPTVRFLTPPTTIEDVELSFNGLLVIDDVDVTEANPPNLLVNITVTKGTLRLASPCATASNSYFEFRAGGTQLLIQNTKLNIANCIRNVFYTPNPDSNDDTLPGKASITVTVNDLGNTGSGGPQTTSVTVPLTVTPVNDPPLIWTPPFLFTDEDVPLHGINITIIDVDSTNDIAINLTVGHGMLNSSYYGLGPARYISFRGNLPQITDILSKITYTPDLNYNDINGDILTIDSDDNINKGITKTVPIIVDAVNDPPEIKFSCSTCPGGWSTTYPVTYPTGSPLTFSSSPPTIKVEDVDAGSNLIQILLHADLYTIQLASTSGLILNYPSTLTVSGSGCSPICPTIILAMGSLTDINNALLAMKLTRTSGVAADDFIIAANDLKNTGKGMAGFDVKVIPLSP